MTETVTPASEAPTDIAQPPSPAAETPPAAAGAPPADKREPGKAAVEIAFATAEDLFGKAKRAEDYPVNLPMPDGSAKKVKLHLEAVDGPTYDKLIEKCPPTREQAQRGLQTNPDEFEPLLASVVITRPALEKADWKRLRGSENWAGGEWASLIMKCQSICMQGLDVPFSVSG